MISKKKVVPSAPNSSANNSSSSNNNNSGPPTGKKRQSIISTLTSKTYVTLGHSVPPDRVADAAAQLHQQQQQQQQGSSGGNYTPVQSNDQIHSELTHRASQVKQLIYSMQLHRQNNARQKKLQQAREQVSQISNPERWRDDQQPHEPDEFV
jgi:hypothetical protein